MFKGKNFGKSESENEQFTLTPSQFMSIIMSSIVGIGVLTLPRDVTQGAHQSGWLSILLGGVVSFIGILLYLQLGKKYPMQNFVSIGTDLLGSPRHPWVGKVLFFPIILGWLVYWTVTTAFVARTFGEVVVTAVLLRTPLEVVVLSMLLVSFAMVMYNLEVMARVNEVLLPVLIIPIVAISLLSFQTSTFIRLLPLQVDLKGLLQGSIAGFFAYQGYEIASLIIGNIDVRSKKVTRAALFGVLVPMIMYMLIVIAGITAFGYEELQRLMWPTLELVKTTEVPGLILERLESAFLGVWVAAVYTSVANFFFSICFLLQLSFKIKNHRYIAVILLPVIYFIAMWPANVHQLFQYFKYTSYFGFVFYMGSPIFLLLVHLIRKGVRMSASGEKQS